MTRVARPEGWLSRQLEHPWGNWSHWCGRCGPSVAIVCHAAEQGGGERSQ